ncbi:type II toxin-antitoxin system Phd/YefM family antitoxin [Methylovulum psychrotolerans]|uniref:Antitoxin n=1 Tax=Methylovulum psychrotolerans TaxID=1704499 RepID=A0A1Z4BXJ0_9GAMM|nr:type II toxin-antitoxin system Phd/YefM family antitoxin [Methylovulum psychrotolerans]ASF45963.1 type II toxin-antitoxin system prevent-host-death family antitoxin [Methylovulum psychrotolerans]
MDATTYTFARAHLAETMEKVCDNHEPVIITKNRDRHVHAVVMISLEDYQALEETAYLLKNPALCSRHINN